MSWNVAMSKPRQDGLKDQVHAPLNGRRKSLATRSLSPLLRMNLARTPLMTVMMMMTRMAQTLPTAELEFGVILLVLAKR